MLVEIIGTQLPGRSFPCDDGSCYDNVHVGIGRPPKTAGLVAGDATEAQWVVEVRVRVGHDGSTDFGGPYVYGSKGDRAIGLPWGTVDAEGTFEMFRAARLRLVDVDPVLTRRPSGEVAWSDGSASPTRSGGHDVRAHPISAGATSPSWIDPAISPLVGRGWWTGRPRSSPPIGR